MDHWSSLPALGWIIVALFFGYASGLIHCFFMHWFKGEAYCPRCRYYLNWRDTLLREIVPDWIQKRHQKDPWERQDSAVSN